MRMVALGSFALLNTADLLSTWIDLHAGMREGNPLMAALLATHGFGALIAFKLLVVACAALTVALFPPATACWFLVGCDVLVAATVASNLYLLDPAVLVVTLAWLCIVAGGVMLAWAAIRWLERDRAAMRAQIDQWRAATPRHWWPQE